MVIPRRSDIPVATGLVIPASLRDSNVAPTKPDATDAGWPYGTTAVTAAVGWLSPVRLQTESRDVPRFPFAQIHAWYPTFRQQFILSIVKR